MPGFLAFEFLHGRVVRGPLSILQGLRMSNIFQYVIKLRNKLADCSQNANISVTKYKTYFYLKSQDRQFQHGDEVLVLLLDSSSKMLMSWSGPHTVLERKNRVNYFTDKDGKQKLYHADILKRYHRRPHINQATVLNEPSTSSEWQDPP